MVENLMLTAIFFLFGFGVGVVTYHLYMEP